jgi:hypothetical protein
MEILVGILAFVGIWFLIRALSRGLIRLGNWAGRVSDSLNSLSDSMRASPPSASNRELLEGLRKTEETVKAAARDRESEDQYKARVRKEIDEAEKLMNKTIKKGSD